MKSVLLIGMGRFGRHMAEKLRSLGHEVLAVDRNENRINAVLPYVDSAQIGDSTDSRFLDQLGIQSFDLCIVAIGDDFQSSVETVCLLKEKGAKKLIARATRDIHARILRRSGANEVVYAERQMAEWAALRYTADHVYDYMELSPDYSIFEAEVPDTWLGKTPTQLNIRRAFKVNIMGVKSNNELKITGIADHVFAPKEKVLILGSNNDVQKVLHK